MVAAVLFASGLVHLGVLAFSGDEWTGPLSFRKAASFGTSFGLTLAAVTLAGRLIPATRAWSVLLAPFTAACVIETFLVSVQVWRGVPSHFDFETPPDSAIAMTLAAGGGVLILTGLGFTVIAMRASASRPVLLALRASFVALLAGFGVGAVMVSRGVRLARGGEADRAYATAGSLKPLHAVLLHGALLLLPIAWLASRSGLDDRHQLLVVQASTVVYAAVTVWVGLLVF